MGGIAVLSALGIVTGVAVVMTGRGHPFSTGAGGIAVAASVVCLAVSVLSLVFG